MSTVIFNDDQFAKDLREFRGEQSQLELANVLGTNRSTISLLENAKSIPTLEILRGFCEKANKNIDIYFIKEENDPVLLMMGKIKESDKEILEQVLERVNIREKYISIHRRCMK